MRVLLIEDNTQPARAIQASLEQQGYYVDVVGTVREGCEAAAIAHYDVIVMHDLLPDGDDVESCRRLRRRALATPILMLSSLGSTQHKDTGLAAGADDYLAQPFEHAELLARLRSLLRRAQASADAVIRSGDLVMNLTEHRVRQDGVEVQLSAKEYALLEFMMRAPGRLLTRAMISESVWDMNYESSSTDIDVHVASLRRKIDRDPTRRRIETVLGSGYLFVEPGGQAAGDRPASSDRPAAGDPGDIGTVGRRASAGRQNPANALLALATPRAILVGSCVLVLACAAAAWSERTAMTGCALAVALVVLAATASWVARRRAAAVSARRARGETATWREISLEQERFLAELAHEIKTPMSIVLNEAELILACSDDPVVVRDNAKSIVDYVSHLAALCDGFLQLEGPFASVDASHPVPVHVHDAVLEAVRGAEAAARCRGVNIVTTLADTGDDAELEVLGDPVLLTATIETLVRNAVHAAPRATPVELRISATSARIVVQVRNHGAAIAPAQLAAAFDRFVARPGAAPRAAALGAGLAIARRIALHHRGTLSLQNHPEAGFEFELSLPRWPVDGRLPKRSAVLAASTASRRSGSAVEPEIPSHDEDR
jgi:DNA-binding response OmpR family regulator/nitrogen-specific signal transduction histidine kinase